MRSIFRFFILVLSSFIGVRRRRDSQEDAHLNPLGIILTAFILLVLFVGLLIFIVKTIA